MMKCYQAETPFFHVDLRLETPALAPGRKAGPPEAGVEPHLLGRLAMCGPRSGLRERVV